MLRNKGTNPVANCGLFHQVPKAIRDAMRLSASYKIMRTSVCHQGDTPRGDHVDIFGERSVRQREVNCKRETR
jgi:hypothetical protein